MPDLISCQQYLITAWTQTQLMFSDMLKFRMSLPHRSSLKALSELQYTRPELLYSMDMSWSLHMLEHLCSTINTFFFNTSCTFLSQISQENLWQIGRWVWYRPPSVMDRAQESPWAGKAHQRVGTAAGGETGEAEDAERGLGQEDGDEVCRPFLLLLLSF